MLGVDLKDLKKNKKMVASGIIGNFLENFDLMLCGFLTPLFAKEFMPPNSEANGIFYVLAIFLVTHLARPIGSLFWGAISDQTGRKNVLILTLWLIGLSTTFIGCIPPYAKIGFMATALFIILRFTQQVAVGGEYISSISYLIENAKPGTKGFYGSLVSLGFNLGTLFASAIVLFIMCLIDNNIIPSWSWRVAFFPTIIALSFGLWVRNKLPESFGYIMATSHFEPKTKLAIFKDTLHTVKNSKARLLALSAIAWLGVSQTSAIFFFTPIYLTSFRQISLVEATHINTLSLFLLVPLIPIFGYFSDRYNPYTLLMSSVIGIIGLTPLFFMTLSAGTMHEILVIKILFSIPSACYYAIAPTIITRSFPIQIRCTSLALFYQTVLAIASGLTPIALLYLSTHKSSFIGPAHYLLLFSTFGLAALVYLKKYNTFVEADPANDPILNV